jgi:hypothetical protein
MSSYPALNPGGTVDFSSSQSQGQVQRIGLVPAKDTDENTNINFDNAELSVSSRCRRG